jgi:hypothetical protein
VASTDVAGFAKLPPATRQQIASQHGRFVPLRRVGDESRFDRNYNVANALDGDPETSPFPSSSEVGAVLDLAAVAVVPDTNAASVTESKEVREKRFLNKLTIIICDADGRPSAEKRKREIEEASGEVVLIEIPKKELESGDYNGRLATALQPYSANEVEVVEYGHSGPLKAYSKVMTVVGAALELLEGRPGSVSYTDYGCNTGATRYRNPDNLDFVPGNNGVALASQHISAGLLPGQEVKIKTNQFFMMGVSAPWPLPANTFLDLQQRTTSRGFEVNIQNGKVEANSLGSNTIPRDLQPDPYDDDKQDYNSGFGASY